MVMFSRLKKITSSILKDGKSTVDDADDTQTNKSSPAAAPPLTVYDDAMSMLAGALIIYFFADLRDMARNGDMIEASLEDLSPPLSAKKVLVIVQNNQDALAKRAIDSDDLRKRLEAFHSLQVQEEGGIFDRLFHEPSSSSLSEHGGNSARDTNKNPQTIMTHFGDTKAKEEMVHSIVVNEKHRRITVVFRGSVTNKDFMQDAKIAQKRMPNPVADLIELEEHTTEDIKIHTGFYEYLFCKNKETEETRLEEILAQVKESLENYPDFSVYCCGHSLGGALSTLFGFFAASNTDLQPLLVKGGPIVVYSIASPYVGDWKFRFAFQHLERTKRIQHLRIANLEDMVTLMPFGAPKLTALSPALSMIKGAGNLYKHCGMRLLMTSDDKKKADTDPIFTLSYPKEHEANDEEYASEIKDSLNAGRSLSAALYCMIRNDMDKITNFHSCEEYEQRLEKCQTALAGVTLDELYADKLVVGDILDADYSPRKPESGFRRAAKAIGYMTSSSGRQSSSETTEDALSP